ncbi:hypothetical protein HK103_002444 [Boothiomyces macroporosus]|uniref:NLE domain-containing protein n=1 Tax=Boothiomyces macroporosus TaxID=261099 RepID=A0AAD5Y011_9FUNG|nr:hypothetical protein HK103_002444 [Boothiomyces macroporosus]
MPQEKKAYELRTHKPYPTDPLLKKKDRPKAPENTKVFAQFVDPDGQVCGPPLNLPVDATPEQLALLLNNLLENEDPLPYSFFCQDTEITQDLFVDIIDGKKVSTESKVTIVYQPQAVFKVRTVTRCSSSLTGHTEAVIAVCFSPDGKMLATGSGDTTVRVWDLNTETPRYTLAGHKNWVQLVAWSPDCQLLVSGSMDSTLIVWNPHKGVAIGDPLRAHSQVITSIAFEPYHLNKACNRFVSSSKDNTAKVWDATLRKVLFTLAQHTAPVMCVKWGGNGFIYTGSRDKTIKVWDSNTGKLIRNLDGHAHWVNHLALSSDFYLRTGPFDHTSPVFKSKDEEYNAARKRYNEFIAKHGNERLASGSDDFTLFLWDPTVQKKSIARMTGHQQPVNHLSFSPDGKTLASASFDKSVKLWNLKGDDSRQVLSGSKDTTLKVWELKTGKMKQELPGHADEVYAVDWSPAGDKVASGGKDRVLKM